MVLCESEKTFEYNNKQYCLFADKKNADKKFESMSEKDLTTKKYWAIIAPQITLNITRGYYQFYNYNPDEGEQSSFSMNADKVSRFFKDNDVIINNSTDSTVATEDIKTIISEIISAEMIRASNNLKNKPHNIVFVQYHDKFYLVSFNKENKIDKMKEITPFTDCGNEPGYLLRTDIKLCINANTAYLYMHLPESTNSQSVPKKSILRPVLTDSIITHKFPLNIKKVHIYFLDKFDNFDNINIHKPENDSSEV